MEHGSTTDVAGRDSGATAEVAVGDLVIEDAAEVDLSKLLTHSFYTCFTTYVGGGDESVSNDTVAADSVRIRAA